MLSKGRMFTLRSTCHCLTVKSKCLYTHLKWRSCSFSMSESEVASLYMLWVCVCVWEREREKPCRVRYRNQREGEREREGNRCRKTTRQTAWFCHSLGFCIMHQDLCDSYVSNLWHTCSRLLCVWWCRKKKVFLMLLYCNKGWCLVLRFASLSLDFYTGFLRCYLN